MVVNRLVLEPMAWEAIREHGVRGGGEEVCGVLVGREEGEALCVTRTVEAANVADPHERGRRFLMDPRVVLNVQRALRGSGERLLGFYHSHPDGSSEPSAPDRSYMVLWPGTAWLIVPVAGGVPAGAPRAWWLEENAVMARELELELVLPPSDH